MRVKINSWHYKLICFADFGIPNNLCAYFWKVVFSALFLVAMAIFVLFLAATATIAVTSFIWVWFFGIEYEIGIFAMIMYCFVGFFILHSKSYPQRGIWAVEIVGRRESTEPNLLIEWIRAKKQKICPMIEFIDES